MHYKLRAVEDKDAQAVMEIFNYYATQSFAAYLDKPLPITYFPKLKAMSAGYPFYVVAAVTGPVVGFGLLRPFHMSDVFRRTAEISYFLRPEATRQQLGAQLLNKLTTDARAGGVRTLLASVSSKNFASLNFHRKHGFRECGRFKSIGTKFGEVFDIVWMQKFT